MRASFVYLMQRSPDRRQSSRNETGTKGTAAPERLLRPSYPAAIASAAIAQRICHPRCSPRIARSKRKLNTKYSAKWAILRMKKYNRSRVSALACGISQCSAGIINWDVWLSEKASVEAQEIRMAHATTGNHGFRGCVIGRMADSTIQPDSSEPHAL